MADVRWTVLVPVKALPDAKSRLAGFSPDAEAHARLVRAIRADTLQAARSAERVGRVLRIGDRPGGEHDVVQAHPGLNAAILDGARHARAYWADDPVAVLVGDLPALTSAELDAALAFGAACERGFVADASGTGTTLLTALRGARLHPQFGPDSAARHARQATLLPAGPGLRHDVDTADDLRSALLLGVGLRTLSVVAAARGEGRAFMRPDRAS